MSSTATPVASPFNCRSSQVSVHSAHSYSRPVQYCNYSTVRRAPVHSRPGPPRQHPHRGLSHARRAAVQPATKSPTEFRAVPPTPRPMALPAAVLLLAAAAPLTQAAALGKFVGEPDCQCDPSRSGFCNYGEELTTTFDCRGPGAKCSSAILDHLLNDTNPK